MALTGGRYVGVGSEWLKESREMRMTGRGVVEESEMEGRRRRSKKVRVGDGNGTTMG